MVLPKRWPHGVTYEVFVQSFCDGNGDGIGDLPGLTSKLDYLQELGIEAIWLMPINPSPSYHKYDVTDYYDIHPDYGTLEDFRVFIEEAHKRDIKVIIDLVLNHCSKLHPWFSSALHKDSPYREYFIWSTMEEIIAAGTLTKEQSGDSDNQQQWNAIPNQDELYFSFFWSGMPDLNFDHPAVQEEAFRIGKFWLTEMKVDGFRLDAAKHIFPDNRAKDTHAFWKTFQERMETYQPNVYLIGEVWSDLEDQIPYAEGFSALFNFDLAYSILETIKNERVVQASVAKDSWKLHSGSPVALLNASTKAFHHLNPDFLNATFLTNHDQERVLSFLKKNKKKARLAASILFSIPGSPYIYYGEEIGMLGQKPDIHLREPFPWNNHEDHTTTHWMDPIHNVSQKITPLSKQLNDPHSFYHHYKTLIALRRHSAALSTGTIESQNFHDDQILSYIRQSESESILVVHNLSESIKKFPTPPDHQDIHFSSSKELIQDQDVIVLPAYSSIFLSNTQTQHS